MGRIILYWIFIFLILSCKSIEPDYNIRTDLLRDDIVYLDPSFNLDDCIVDGKIEEALKQVFVECIDAPYEFSRESPRYKNYYISGTLCIDPKGNVKLIHDVISKKVNKKRKVELINRYFSLSFRITNQIDCLQCGQFFMGSLR